MLLVVAVYLVAVAKLWRDNLDANRVALTHVNSMLVQGVRTTLKGHEIDPARAWADSWCR